MEFNTTSYGVAKVNKSNYADGNLAICLTDESGMPLTKLSVNMPDNAHLLGKNQFFAKTYAENEEIAEDALNSGLFKQTSITVKSGWVACPIWEILTP
jgi:hypothetical protein